MKTMASNSENQSRDPIRKVVEEEGIAAKNLVNWIADGSIDGVDGSKTNKKPPPFPRPQSISPRPPMKEQEKKTDAKLQCKGSKKRTLTSRPKNRLRSASAGRNPEKDLRARYWTFLFENLHRAVDEIYQTCEMDESIVESKEAIMMLENYSKEFQALIQWLNISKSYEKATPLNRPTSLAWEVRKSSPGKSLLKNVFIDRLTAGNGSAKRVLYFDTPGDVKSFAMTTDKGSISQVQLKNEAEPILQKDEKIPEAESDGIPSQNIEAITPPKSCDVIVSVHKPPEKSLSTNKDLIINEVCCVSGKPPISNPAIIIENDKSDTNQNTDETLAENSSNGLNEDETLLVEQSNMNVPVKDIEPAEDMSDCPKPNICISDEIPKEPIQECHESVNEADQDKIINTDQNAQISIEEIKTEVNDLSKSETIENTATSIDTQCNKNKNSVTKNVASTPTIQSNPHKIPEKDINVAIKNQKNIELTNNATQSMNKPTMNYSSRVAAKNLKNTAKTNLISPKPVAANEKSAIPSNKIENNVKPALKKNIENSTPKTTSSATEISRNTRAAISTRTFTGVVTKSRANAENLGARKSTECTTKTPVMKTVNTGRTLQPRLALTEKKPLRVNNSGTRIRGTVTPSTRIVKPDVRVPKATPTRTGTSSARLPQKSGSFSSINNMRNTGTWACKSKASSCKQIPEISKPAVEKDLDGWETVRGRTRSRNSPAKKLPANDNKESQVAHLAKLNQARIGGFPYTNKTSTSSKISAKTPEPKKATPKPPEKKESSATSKPVSGQSLSKSSDAKKKSAEPTTKSKTLQSTRRLSDVKTFNKSINSASNKNISEEPEKAKLIKSKVSENTSKDITKQNEVAKDKNLNSPDSEVKNSDDASKVLKPLHVDVNSSQQANQQAIKSSGMNSRYNSGLCQESDEEMYTFTKTLSSQSSKVEDSGITSANDLLEMKLNNDSPMQKSSDDTSFDESDTGLTSDDQDGNAYQDEAYDLHIQDLPDCSVEYKMLEQKVHKLHLSWGEQMDQLDLELRTPGRALEMHEKLSSPFRKRSLLESIQLSQEKQLKAQEQREKYLEEKAQRYKHIEKKRQEMNAQTKKKQEQLRLDVEQKLQRAEEKRKRQLEMIIKKAHDEEEKVNEIAFINTLEAQNKRHDLISKEKDHEARLQDIQDERQRKQEEKAAKEAAAEERRKLLEAERQARLIEMQEKRKQRDLKIEQQQLEKEKERQELANQKARDRELRLSALNAAQQTTIEELQKKIQLKQEESARRHEENMEQIRQKAFELSVRRCSSNNDDAPQPVPYDTKKICTMCNVLIGSEVYLLSHLRGKKHQETVKDQHQGQDPSTEELELYNLKHIVDASIDQLNPNIALDKERQKALKKRCKKLRQRMTNKGLEYESKQKPRESSGNAKLIKVLNDLKKSTNNVDINLLTNLDRCLSDMRQTSFKGSNSENKLQFLGGFGTIIDIYSIVVNFTHEKNIFIVKKVVDHIGELAASVVGNYENCIYVLYSNKIGCLLDILIRRLNIFIPDNYAQLIATSTKSLGSNLRNDHTASNLLQLLNNILTSLSVQQNDSSKLDTSKIENKEEFQQRVQDVISYIVSIGIVDKLSQYFHSFQGPITNEDDVSPFVLACTGFLTSLIKLFTDCFNAEYDRKKTGDATQLIASLQVTNMVGSVSFLYGLLLHSGAAARGETPPLQLSNQTELIAFATLRMLNYMAVMNLQVFQGVLGSEGLSLQLRHIISHLLWYCNHWTSDSLLHETILLVGYFTALNPDNQAIIQAGQRPTVLLQLCSLPFMYFSDSKLTDVLFPTLIACCFNNSSNKIILEQEMSSELLANYIEDKCLNIHTMNSSKSKSDTLDKRWLFSTRFPKDHWVLAKQYFSAA